MDERKRKKAEMWAELANNWREAFGKTPRKTPPFVKQEEPVVKHLENNIPTDENKSHLYLEKQNEYKQILVQQAAWQQEKEQQELWLQGEKQRYEYDLECRRLQMEKEIRIYEADLQNQYLSYQQQIEIEKLKLEIEYLKTQLARSR